MFHQHITELTLRDRYRFALATYLIEALYDRKAFSRGVNCHAIVRAMAHFLNARVVTGVFRVVGWDGESHIVVEHEHSWVKMSRGWILDIKPVGMMAFSPLAVDLKPGSGVGYSSYRQLPYKSFPKAAASDVTNEQTQRLGMIIADIVCDSSFPGEQIMEKYYRSG